MTTPDLNLFAGKNALREYYDPDLQRPLPLVEIPEKLNLFYDDGVRIYAKMMTMLPAHNVKSIPVLNMISSPLGTPKPKKFIEYSSGSTVTSLSILARVFHGVEDTHAYLSNKADHAKLRMLRFFGLNITLFGGPSQPEPTDHRGGILRARQEAAEDPSVINMNQYENDMNWQAHFRWTGPQLLKQLPNMSVFCAGLGTTGTMTGVGLYLKQHRPDIVKIGVNTVEGDIVPGTRSVPLMRPVQFPWRDAVDVVELAGSFDSFRLSLALTREGLICGPSSGHNFHGLNCFLDRRKKQGSLRQLAGDDGLIHAAFICCDLPFQYIEEYYNQLPSSFFPEIRNECLLHVDRYHYNELWEVCSTELLPRLYPVLRDIPPTPGAWGEVLSNPLTHSSTETRILDLRNTADFNIRHLPGAVSKPLDSLKAGMTSPYFDNAVLEAVWRELEAKFGSGLPEDEVDKTKDVVLICYDGDASRVATSVLQARGIKGVNLKKGMKGLEEMSLFFNHN